MNLIDTHTHIYSEAFDADRQDAMLRAEEAGVHALLLPAIDSGYHEKLMDTARAFPRACFPMMGLHPTSVKDNYLEELTIVEGYLANPGFRFYAIGEIGIDLYWDKTHEAEQREAFGHQLDLAVKYGLPVAIHTRNSMDIALNMVEERHGSNLRGVFHCFSGNLEQAKRAIGLGFMLGIGGVATYKNSGLQAVVGHIAIDNLLLETDAPWLPPVPYRGERNEPAYLLYVARKIAEIKNISVEEVAERTSANATALFRL